MQAARRAAPFFLCMLVTLGMVQCELQIDEQDSELLNHATGIDVVIHNGQAPPLKLASGREHYFDKISLKVSWNDFPAPDVTDWLISHSEFRELDWTNLIGVMTRWEAAADRTFTEIVNQQEALWMRKDPAFTLTFNDSAGQAVAGPFTLNGSHFNIDRQFAVRWAEGAPMAGNYGGNLGASDSFLLTSAGSYTGVQDDVYTVVVAAGGQLDGTASVEVRSVLGDTSGPIPVVSGVPIALGSPASGATITFAETASGVVLVAGDRWNIRCFGTTGTVGQPVPAPQANFNALAQILLSSARSDIERFTVPEQAVQLEVIWSGLPDIAYRIPVEIDPSPAFSRGLLASVQMSSPANGRYFQPGDAIEISLELTDADGNRLHPEDQLPSYRQFLQGVSNGIQYYQASSEPCQPYFSDCGLNLLSLEVAGPRHRIEQNYELGEPETHFQAGFEFPSMDVIFGGYSNPTLWDNPIPNTVTVDLPVDAEPGTYIVLVKASRTYLGETQNVLETFPFQVGTAEVTYRTAPAGNCDVCHNGTGRLERLRHEARDGQSCSICHNRPYALAGQVVHELHFFSKNYRQHRNDCSLCHIEPGSNARVSPASCGVCHDNIHKGEFDLGFVDPYQRCGLSCHGDQVHVQGMVGN